MTALFRNLSICYTAGLVGGLVNAVFVWASGAFGLTEMLGVAITPEWTPAFLYQKMVWGGIWGLVLTLPVFTNSVLLRGFLFGLMPSLMAFLFVLPNVAGEGLFGLKLGMLTPLVILVYATIWGVVAAWWVTRCQEPGLTRKPL